MHTPKYYHIIVKQRSRVAISWIRSIFNSNLAPSFLLQIKLPEVIKSIDFVIYSSKYIHFILVNNSWVPWSFAWCLFGDWRDLCPFRSIEIELPEIIFSAGINKASEYNHRCFTILIAPPDEWVIVASLRSILYNFNYSVCNTLISGNFDH